MIAVECVCGVVITNAAEAKQHIADHPEWEVRAELRVITARTGSLVRVTAEAPDGYVWRDGHVHELVAEGRGGRAATNEAQCDVRERMKIGLDRCDDAECDWCHE